MAKGSGATTYYVAGLVFMTLVCAGLLGFAYRLNQDLTESYEKAAAIDERTAQVTAQVQASLKELKELRRLFYGAKPGEPEEPARTDPISYAHYKTTFLDPAGKQIREILAQEFPAEGEWKTLQDQKTKDAWDLLVKHRSDEVKYSNLADIFTDVHQQLAGLLHIASGIEAERLSALSDVDMVRNTSRQLLQQRQREIEELRGEKNRLQDQSIVMAREFDLERRRFGEEKENINKERGRLEREFRLNEARLESENSQLQGEIDDLTKRPRRRFADRGDADGSVVFADVGLGYAWIDLGRSHGVKPNMRFQVYQLDQGAAQRIKGMVEVRRLEDDMAQCAILQDIELTHPVTGKRLVLPDRNDPIAKGDLLRSPIFDQDMERTFVFLGDRLQTRNPTLPELQKKLVELGAKVAREVSLETDFVVQLSAGEDDVEILDRAKKAAQLNAIFMDEGELLEYIPR